LPSSLSLRTRLRRTPTAANSAATYKAFARSKTPKISQTESDTAYSVKQN
jgi:hypothetical protein